MPEPRNVLYYGDNFDILRRYVKDESVDLVYLDPPFNSNADYNVLFAEHSSEKSHAQIKAFADTWQWDTEAARNFAEAVETGGEHVAKCLVAFKKFLGQSDMLAYLSMMAPRLVELHRALKITGSIYLHCDPTASHYLKMLMDAVFRPDNFHGEIIWKRTSAHSNASRNYAAVHDTMLFYSKGPNPTWNRLYQPYDPEYVEEHFVHKDPDGRVFRRVDLVNPAYRPNLVYEYKGYKPHPNGWKVTKEKMEQLDREGKLFFPKKGISGRIRRKLYLDDSLGAPVSDIWTDIPPIHAAAAERLGYPTQKPEALLERVIAASSNEGDVILDPFCGCGTAIAAAQKLKRRWIGIDITHLAVNLIKVRLADSFGKTITKAYNVVGEPEDLESAKALADADKYQFQYWALGLIGARPAASQEKKGADKGIDGRLYISDSFGEVRSIIISVKGAMFPLPKSATYAVSSNEKTRPSVSSSRWRR